MAHSKQASLPTKPRKDFPLYVHRSDRWAKKVRRKTEFFGKASTDPDGKAALEEWLRVKDSLLAGRPRPPKGDDIVKLADVINPFLANKEQRRDSGEIAPRTFIRYEATGKMLAEFFGRDRSVEDLSPADFEALRAHMAKRWGPVALGVEIQNVRSIFRYAFRQEIISKPARFGAGFDKPSAQVLLKHSTKDGEKMFTAAQILKLLDVASVNVKAMTLLGINGALGNTDIGELPIKAFDLERGWLSYARVKTGVPRKIPLWPETVAAVKEVIEKRPEPKDPTNGHLLFIGKRGESYIGNHKGYRVGQEFDHALSDAKIEGRTFYDLRRTFQTIGENSRDLSAVQAIMGHTPRASDMSARYRQRVDDERLVATVNVVRDWLYPLAKGPTETTDKTKAKAKPKLAGRTVRPKGPNGPMVKGFVLRIVGWNLSIGFAAELPHRLNRSAWRFTFATWPG